MFLCKLLTCHSMLLLLHQVTESFRPLNSIFSFENFPFQLRLLHPVINSFHAKLHRVQLSINFILVLKPLCEYLHIIVKKIQQFKFRVCTKHNLHCSIEVPFANAPIGIEIQDIVEKPNMEILGLIDQLLCAVAESSIVNILISFEVRVMSLYFFVQSLTEALTEALKHEGFKTFFIEPKPKNEF